MAPAASSNPAAYEKNEKVLCFHHELLYEAKVMDDPQREDEKDKMSPWKYRVHYKGWKNTYCLFSEAITTSHNLVTSNSPLETTSHTEGEHFYTTQSYLWLTTLLSTFLQSLTSEMARVKWVVDETPAPPAPSPPSSPPLAPAVEDAPPTPEPLRRSLRNIEKSSADAFETRWDDWVPQDRLRKLTEDNRELAVSLRRDVMQAENRQRNPKSTASSKKGRTQGSEIGSGRGSEERHSSVPAGSRGTKRGKDNEIEKVATPDFPTPRRSSRMQSTGLSQSSVPNSPDLIPSGSDQDNKTEIEASRMLLELKNESSVAAKSNKGGTFRLQVAPGGKAGVHDRGAKTMALRTIHGRYDEDGDLIPSKAEVISRRGYFKDGKLLSPDLDTATNIKPQAASRLSRRSERSEQHSDRQNKHLSMPDETTCTDEEMFQFVKDVISRPPPPDEPEHMTVETFKSGHYWAPLIGGTSENERAQIEEEAREMGLWAPKRQVHPQYAKTRVNDPLNANRLHFFENQDPDRKLMTAGVPKDPTNIDPPGSGTPFDALKYPDRLVQLPAQVLGNLTIIDLQQLDRATVIRFPNSALRMLPPKFLTKLKIPIPSENDNNDNYFQEEAFYARPSVHFTVPDMIKGYLVDDWENVTKSLTLVELPSQAPVNWILDTYFHEEKGKRRLGSAEADRLVEIAEGMKTYFEKMLGKTLLYKFERGQYAGVRKLWEAGKNDWEGKGPGDCYGVEHLCRLIVNMPEWIAQTNMDPQSVGKVKEEMTLLNQWICRNHQRLFINQYERPSAEYIEHARD